MHITVTIDDELYQRAFELADPGMDEATLLREAMQAFIRMQRGKRLAVSGAQASQAADVPRRRSLAEVLTAIPPAQYDDGWDALTHPTMGPIEKS